MLLGYVYKLRPDKEQSDTMNSWLDMLRTNYNYNLRERIDGYYFRFIQGEYCDLKTKAEVCPLTCHVGGLEGHPWKVSGGEKTKKQQEAGIFGDYCDIETKKVNKVTSVKLAKRNVGEIQMSELPALKKTKPWYAGIDSTVLQENIKRLDKAYEKFFKGAGFPNFKNRSTFRSFTYALGVKIDGNKIYLPSYRTGRILQFSSCS